MIDLLRIFPLDRRGASRIPERSAPTSHNVGSPRGDSPHTSAPRSSKTLRRNRCDFARVASSIDPRPTRCRAIA